MKTKNRLAAALKAEGLHDLASAALGGRFDDYESDSPTPQMDLVACLRGVGREDLAERAMNGEWEGTKEEAEAWAESPEGQAVLGGLTRED